MKADPQSKLIALPAQESGDDLKYSLLDSLETLRQAGGVLGAASKCRLDILLPDARLPVVGASAVAPVVCARISPKTPTSERVMCSAVCGVCGCAG